MLVSARRAVIAMSDAWFVERSEGEGILYLEEVRGYVRFGVGRGTLYGMYYTHTHTYPK